MGARKRIARTSREIMEEDINIAIKKAKIRFRSMSKFYILEYRTVFFASGYPEIDKETNEEIYKFKYLFDDDYKKWRCVDGNKSSI